MSKLLPYNIRFLLLFLGVFSVANAQQYPQVQAKIDRDTILIGQQIKYQLSVEADSLEAVRFPEGQTFMPLEMVTASAIDTFRQKERFRLVKEYQITQFDSGAYTIPAQKVAVGSKIVSTDSIKVAVRTVAVDTLKQPMYGIKPIIEVKNPSGKATTYLLLIIGVLLLIGFLVYWFFIRKKTLTEEEKIQQLPPFDRALLGLKKLQNSKYLLEAKYKEYYSELTDIVRNYLEEEVHISATESTTEELLEKIRLLQDSGKIHLKTETIDNLRRVLRNADLAKFAKSHPSDSVAEDDRNTIEQVVVNTKEALPEPTPEELAETQAYQEYLIQQKRKRKKIWIIVSSVFLFLIIAGGTVAYLGVSYVKDKILGNTSRELAEGEWITSEYGYPVIQLTTPEVLKRSHLQLPAEVTQNIESFQMFEYGSLIGNMHIAASVLVPKQGIEFNPEMSANGFLAQIQNAGAKNVTTFQEEYTTARGVKGLKVYGTADMPIVKGQPATVKDQYEMYLFNQNGAVELLFILYKDGDTFGKEIAERVVQSIEFKNQ